MGGDRGREEFTAVGRARCGRGEGKGWRQHRQLKISRPHLEAFLGPGVTVPATCEV